MMINGDEYDRYIGKIVREVISTFEGFNFSKEDLHQRGWLELIKADGRYDPGKGAKFTTYAYKSVMEGIKEEAIFQINRSGVTGKEHVTSADCVSIDDENGIVVKISEDLSWEQYGAGDEGKEDDRAENLRMNLQLLTENEKKVLYAAYGIECERCTNTRRIAQMLNMRELEVKKAMESGKRKLRELSDGRK